MEMVKVHLKMVSQHVLGKPAENTETVTQSRWSLNRFERRNLSTQQCQGFACDLPWTMSHKIWWTKSKFKALRPTLSSYCTVIMYLCSWQVLGCQNHLHPTF